MGSPKSLFNLFTYHHSLESNIEKKTRFEVEERDDWDKSVNKYKKLIFLL